MVSSVYAEFHIIAIPRAFFIGVDMCSHKTWICPKCGVLCCTRDELRKHNRIVHAVIAKNRPQPYSWECPICHNYFKTKRERDSHRIDVHGKYCSDNYGPKMSNGLKRVWICKYCLIDCKSRRRLAKHYLECNAKHRLPVDSLGRTYYPGERRKTMTNLRQRILDGTLIRKPCSEETRRKLSEIRKKQITEGRGSSTWVNPHIHRSYAEQYFYDILVKELDSTVVWRNNHRACGYLLDFANLTTKVYFEVDGESHYTLEGMDYDAKRTEELADNGWFLIGRIRWKYYKKMKPEEQRRIVQQYLTEFVSAESNAIQPIIDRCAKPELPVHEISKRQQHAIEHQQKLEYAMANGLIRCDGRISGNGVSNAEWERRKKLILDSGVDLMHIGWVAQVTVATGLSKRIIENTLRHFPNTFNGKYFRRRLPNGVHQQ